ncbi:hypothetical protein [uncultured Tolumonas sp.]|uniref:hypothetical protein n=1 Tax=uncultured Tolumonas sp. TaxID=263765 RepID=UPI00292F4B24|nr:hypothetical protein [uncultured Tolumonas sp.]
MSLSRWRMPLTPKLRLSSLALGIVPAIIVLGWLGIWLPTSLRLLMLSLFDQMGELIYYPLAAIALAGGFFFRRTVASRIPLAIFAGRRTRSMDIIELADLLNQDLALVP